MTTQQRQRRRGQGSQRRPPSLRGIGQHAVDLLFPPTCALCAIPIGSSYGQADRIQLCTRCVCDLTSSDSTACYRCARPLPKGLGNRAPAEDSSLCPHCRGKRLRFERTIAIGVYGGIVRDAVLQMKQATGEGLTIALGQLLGQRLLQNITVTPDYVVSVPTHWTRRLGRTVNCPEILLEAVTHQLGLTSSPRLLRCRRKTNKQGTLLPNERLANVRQAYRVSAGYVINGANVLLIDDVMTTGATANEIAKILKRAGAARIEVAVVARGIGFDS